MLNFKGWEKIAEDNKTTTLKHDKGHTMVLAHKKLPKIQQEHLKRLKFAEGTEKGTVGDEATDNGRINRFAAPPPSTNVNVNIPPTNQNGIAQQQIPSQPVPNQTIQTQEEPSNLKDVKMPAVQPPVGPNGEFNPQAGQVATQAGANTLAQIAGEKGKAAAEYNKQLLGETLKQGAKDQQHIDNWRAQTDWAAKQIADNQINPNSYREHMGVGRKVLTAIGMILGGAGAGLVGGNNPAEDFLKDQINRDIDAQKARSKQVETVYGFYKQLYGDENVATNLAKVTMNNVAATQMARTAAKYATPEAQANNAIYQAKIGAENNGLYQKSAGLLGNLENPKLNQAAPQAAPQEAPTDNGERIIPPKEGEKFEPDLSSNGPGFMSAKQIAYMKENPSMVRGSSASASLNKNKQAPKEDYYHAHVLTPEAERLVNNVKRGADADTQNYHPAMEQLTHAQQVEKQIENIRALYPKLRAESTYSGMLKSHLPNIASAAKAGAGNNYLDTAGNLVTHAGNLLTDISGGQQQVGYEADKAALLTYLKTAMPTATEDQIKELMAAKIPGKLDSDENYKKKLDDIIDSLLSTIKTTYLPKGAYKKRGPS